jgi:CDP-diacylglycerol--inositol 3-phosphatidyltransferase
MDSTVPWVLAIISFLPMALKQWINVRQLVAASEWLAEGDIAERKKQGLPRKDGAKKVQ